MSQTAAYRLLARFAGSFVGLALTLAFVSSITLAQPNTPRDLRTIVDSGVLRVALTGFDLPAFHWRSDGTLAGPEIDLIRAAARSSAVHVVIGLNERSPVSLGSLYNTILFIGRDGAVMVMRVGKPADEPGFRRVTKPCLFSRSNQPVAMQHGSWRADHPFHV